MARTDALAADGVIVQSLPKARYRVRLANGHELVAFPERRARVAVDALREGVRVRLEISPADLTQGRIIATETL